ncbi:tail fiber assembly protein [Escherichia coli]|uniref:tail fiber assembly protein n=5 Tax=Escherichia coli TaxID=562 RepID=UPI000945C6B6|nr:tail fiber assembly protein [Escherichia coli]MCD9327912.1 tail fiber assembly protein [Escherichia coli]MCD9330915.1 tail fiber assembly protein [Escherichia coli]MDC6741973.1 tail fiber assembly protein [Escherichia coli]MDC6898085.1 tail fiber assembly protein [Escherichia coli]MDC6902378.1 tail fiber assembly protein [Escherichia coli]
MFYSTEIGFTVGRMSDSQVEITDDYWSELVIGQAGGKVIIANESGFPELSDPAPLTHDQQVAIANQKKAELLAAATFAISPLQYAVTAGIATDEEAARLTSWEDYRVAVMRTDTSTAPDIEWPTRPV